MIHYAFLRIWWISDCCFQIRISNYLKAEDQGEQHPEKRYKKQCEGRVPSTGRQSRSSCRNNPGESVWPKKFWKIGNVPSVKTRWRKGMVIMKKAKIVLLWLLSILFVLLIVQNTASVRAHFLWLTADVPIILLLLFAAAVGFISGLFIGLPMKNAGREITK